MTKYTSIDNILADGIIDSTILEARKNSVAILQHKFVEYSKGEYVTIGYPVLKMFLNPRGTMQGGFITAAFDNTFGTMVTFEKQTLRVATLNININFHCPILENDILYVTVYLKACGKSIVSLYGEGFNENGNLIATATSILKVFNSR